MDFFQDAEGLAAAVFAFTLLFGTILKGHADLRKASMKCAKLEIQLAAVKLKLEQFEHTYLSDGPRSEAYFDPDDDDLPF